MFARLLFRAASGAERPGLGHYQAAFSPLLVGVALAILITFLLRETGPGGARRVAVPAEAMS